MKKDMNDSTYFAYIVNALDVYLTHNNCKDACTRKKNKECKQVTYIKKCIKSLYNSVFYRSLKHEKKSDIKAFYDNVSFFQENINTSAFNTNINKVLGDKKDSVFDGLLILAEYYNIDTHGIKFTEYKHEHNTVATIDNKMPNCFVDSEIHNLSFIIATEIDEKGVVKETSNKTLNTVDKTMFFILLYYSAQRLLLKQSDVDTNLFKVNQYELIKSFFGNKFNPKEHYTNYNRTKVNNAIKALSKSFVKFDVFEDKEAHMHVLNTVNDKKSGNTELISLNDTIVEILTKNIKIFTRYSAVKSTDNFFNLLSFTTKSETYNPIVYRVLSLNGLSVYKKEEGLDGFISTFFKEYSICDRMKKKRLKDEIISILKMLKKNNEILNYSGVKKGETFKIIFKRIPVEAKQKA